MAHKKGLGSTQNTKDTAGKRLGIKLFGGEEAKAGNIIVRQRGTKHHPGEGVGMGKDHTIFAKRDGIVKFKIRKSRSFVNVIEPNGESPESPKSSSGPSKNKKKARKRDRKKRKKRKKVKRSKSKGKKK